MSTASIPSHGSTVDMAQVRGLVDRAIRVAVPPGDLVERPIFPGARTTDILPTPLAGLRGAQLVADAAMQRAYRYAADLRGEGTSWREIADLLDIPWSDEYSRVERAYELVGGPSKQRRGYHAQPTVSWTCGGPVGCRQCITDRGPYNGYPCDNEDGHAEGCRRLATETQEYEREQEEREVRDRVADEAMMALVDDKFGRETVRRARWVQAHGGRYQGWSTSETLAVALALRDETRLKDEGYPGRRDAMQRILAGWPDQPDDPDQWLATVRAAVTGLTDG